jgi:YlmC/YmxH family sporulation protein
MKIVRLSEFIGKEIVNLNTGKKLGKIKKADIVLEASTGKLESIILGNINNNGYILIPYYLIKYIGSKVVLVDLK